MGSIREMVDSSGNVKARYDYDPYGRRTPNQITSGALDADFGFTGHYLHAASGLYLAPCRAYDANLGRWLNRDPIRERGGLNHYAYVHNRPHIGTDPLGLYNPISGPNGPVGPGSGLADPALFYPSLPSIPIDASVAGGGLPTLRSAATLFGGADLANKIAEFGAGKATLGSNFKLYPRGFRGNQYVCTEGVAHLAHEAAPWLAGAGVAMDTMDYFSGGIGGEEYARNTAVAGYGLWGGPPGALTSIVYFSIDSSFPGGWDGYIDYLGVVVQTDAQIAPNTWTLSFPLIGP